ncbi:MAG TPA: IS200/IS605 family transposase [Gemmatimonadales bacterium]|nr:IS200/IS605 family transposase [Gemmatimonadales bacterium]
MPETHVHLRVHLVWSTRHRRPWLDPEWRVRLFAVASGAAERCRARLICAGGVRDHVHLYVELPPTRTLAELVNALKAGTARWIQESFPHRAGFAWQHGYAAFSVAQDEENRLLDYIRHQEVSHRERDFTGEYLSLLEHHGIAYDLRDVLD